MAIANLQRILVSTAYPAFATDGRGQVLGLNESAEALLGYKNASVRGRCCWEMLAGRDRFNNLYCLERCALREMVARGEPVNPFDLRLRTASGAMLEVTMSVVAVSTSDGGTDAIVHLFRPVHRTAEETIQSGNDQPRACELSAAANGRRDPNGARSNGLTPREHEVLALLVAGLNSHGIARTMGISRVTVRNHFKRIFPKLRVHSQAEAVAFAFRNHLT